MNIAERINSNPYRILGLYVGCSPAIESRNKNRIAAYSQIGQEAKFSFPIDDLLPPMTSRTQERVAEASRILSYPADRVRFGLLWISDSASKWGVLLNSAISALLKNDIPEALYNYSELIYDDYNRNEFLQATTRGLLTISTEDLEETLENILKDVIPESSDMRAILNVFAENECKRNPLTDKFFNRIVDSSLNAISSNDIISTSGNIKIYIQKGIPDYFLSFENLKKVGSQLLELANAVKRFYGEKPSECSEILENIADKMYQLNFDLLSPLSFLTIGRESNFEKFKPSWPPLLINNRYLNLMTDIYSYFENFMAELNLSQESRNILYKNQKDFTDFIQPRIDKSEPARKKLRRKMYLKRFGNNFLWFGILGIIGLSWLFQLPVSTWALIFTTLVLYILTYFTLKLTSYI